MQTHRQKKQSLIPELQHSAIPPLEEYTQNSGEITGLKGGRCPERCVERIQKGRVSVVTVVRNSMTSLERTIDSICAQSYADIEYIVVDGGSTDGTIDILKARNDDIDFWLSEPDRGISDAFNKGIALSTGEFITFVNADDWLESDHIELAVRSLTESEAEFSFGNLVLHDQQGAPIYSMLGDPDYAKCLRHAMPALNHPTIVCRRTLYSRNGLYDLSYKIAMDYEWLLRNHLRGAIGIYIMAITSHMGASGLSQRHIRASLQEVRRASVAYGYHPTLAMLRFFVRLSKAQSRVFLEKILPKSIVDGMRRLANPRFRRGSLPSGIQQ